MKKPLLFFIVAVSFVQCWPGISNPGLSRINRNDMLEDSYTSLDYISVFTNAASSSMLVRRDNETSGIVRTWFLVHHQKSLLKKAEHHTEQIQYHLLSLLSIMGLKALPPPLTCC